MSTYTESEIHQGIGAFDQAMRGQTSIPGIASRMQSGVAVGILSAMMRSGLPDARIREIIESIFASTASQFTQILDMFAGDDWAIHLWHLLPSGSYEVCTDLCRQPRPNWRYDPSAAKEVA